MAYEIDEQPAVPTLYVAQPLDLPLLTAVAAFDAHREAARLGGVGKTSVVETPATELFLFGTGAVERSGPSSALRRAPGRLRHRRRLVSVAIEVEVAPWSDTRSQIGIRPRGHAVPLTHGKRQRCYFAHAVAAAEGLAQALERRVEDWMVTQLLDTGDGSLTHVA
jgi:hypothetical protein